MLLVDAPDHAQGLVVADRIARDVLSHLGQRRRVKREALVGRELRHPPRGRLWSCELEEQPFQVARDEDVHRRAGRHHELARGDVVHAGRDEVRQDVVLVARAQ